MFANHKQRANMDVKVRFLINIHLKDRLDMEPTAC